MVKNFGKGHPIAELKELPLFNFLNYVLLWFSWNVDDGRSS
jgi:hypothetical protein